MTKLGILIIFIATVIKLYMSWGFTGTMLLGIILAIIGVFAGSNIKITFDGDDDDDF